VISVVVLQNDVYLLRGEHGYSTETCITSTLVGKKVSGIEAERITNITRKGSRANDISRNRDGIQGKLCACGECKHISYRLYPVLPINLCL
jgi:hypothetical protein